MSLSSQTIKAAGLCGLVLAVGVSGAASALPAIANVAVGNGVATTGRVVDVPVGGARGPGLVTATALSPHVSKQGAVANVMLLNSQRLAGVTAGPASPGSGVSVANPTGRPVFSSVSNAPGLNGVAVPQ